MGCFEAIEDIRNLLDTMQSCFLFRMILLHFISVSSHYSLLGTCSVCKDHSASYFVMSCIVLFGFANIHWFVISCWLLYLLVLSFGSISKLVLSERFSPRTSMDINKKNLSHA